jgi:transcriptional regulator with XRE-family HTH domain
MPPNGFSAALKKLRERRNLSGRELSLIAKIDHAYESRLESGEKANPSEETLDKLLRGLKPNARDAQIFKWLAEHPDTSPEWVLYMLDETSGTIEEFTAGAAMVNRGNVPTPEKTLERVRKILSEE